MKISKIIGSAIICISLLAPAACNKTDRHTKGVNIIEDARMLAIYEREGYDEVFIVNKDGKEVAHYVLLNTADSLPAEIPDEAFIIRVPLTSAAIDSEVYACIFEELGAGEKVAGMFDADFVTKPSLQKGIKSGKIKNLGNTSNPNLEQYISLNPDAALISYFDGMEIRGIEKTDVPIIKMYDLQEPHPLGRAEWIRFLGKLAGDEERADSIYYAVKENYNSIKKSAAAEADAGGRPSVLTELIYNGTWYVPGGLSYPATLIKDAGGKYFKEDNNESATLSLLPEQVLSEGWDSDVWIIRFFGDEEQLRTVLDSNPLYSDIHAYETGNIYFADTRQSPVFTETAFHPDLLLEDYRLIFKGDTVKPLRYFKQLSID